MLLPVLGIIAGLVSVVGDVPYIRDTARRSTIPHRGAWLVWSVLEITAVVTQQADGASWSLVMAVAQAAGTTVVFALSVRFGQGGLSTADLVLIAFAGVGVAGWLVVDEPVIATTCIVAADLVAVVMMIPKTWTDPGSETASTYGWACVAGALAAAAVGSLTPSLLLYPIYFCLTNAAIAALILRRRATLARLATTRHVAVVETIRTPLQVL